MCHALLYEVSLWCLLVDIDRELAATVRSQGCPCGGTLRSARYDLPATWASSISTSLPLHIPAQREQLFWANVNADSGST